jgi:CheY-like chemotaxis protein
MSHLPKLLIVDDEVELLEMYRDFLESEGFEVLTASTGEEALKIFQQNTDVKVIISDSHMGQMNGEEFFNALKKSQNKLPPFLLATGDLNRSEEELKSIGMSGLVLKPFDLDELVMKIKSYI